MLGSGSRLRLLLAIAPALSCVRGASQSVRPSVADCPDSSVRGGISGTTRDEVTGEPISAQLRLDGSESLIWSNAKGDFAFPCLQPGEYNVQVRLIGYTPMSKVVGVTRDSMVHLDLRPRIPGSGPPVDSSLWRPLWEAALALYRRPSPPTDASHLTDVAEATGTPVQRIPDRPAVVLLTRGEYWKTGSARAWVSELILSKTIDAACEAKELSQCVPVGFGSFVALEVPVQESPDTVAIRMDETLLDPIACKRGHGMGDHHSFGVALRKIQGEWRVVGRIGLDLIGGIYCGR